MGRIAFLLFVLIGTLLVGPRSAFGGGFADLEADYDANHFRGAPRGGGDMFPKVVDPPMVGLEEADHALTAADWVIGVSIGGEHQAFPVAMMGLPEIVNLSCGGVPIVATFCVNCQTGIVYLRTVEPEAEVGNAVPRVLTFEHEGTLFRRSFCMYDTATGSIWVHATGLCIKGPFRGRALEMIPSSMTSWERWKERHPDTRVFLCEREPIRGVYAPDQGLAFYGLGIAAPGAFERLGSGGSARLFPYEELRKRPVLNASFDGRALLVVYHAESRISMAWIAEQDGQPTRFFSVRDADGAGDRTVLVHDAETLSTWDALDGRCIRGPLEGSRLVPHVATSWNSAMWKRFYPEGEIWRPE